MYEDGKILARVKILFGADGFGDFALVSERLDRTAPDYGVTYDFTVLEVYLYPNRQKTTKKRESKASHPKLLCAAWEDSSTMSPIGERPVKLNKKKDDLSEQESSLDEESEEE